MASVRVVWDIPPDEITARRDNAIRRGHQRLAHAAADEMRYNAPVLTGRLRDSIRVEYESKYVTWVNVGREDETPYLGWQEFGSIHQPARPFVRPAADKYGGQLEQVMTNEARRALS
jgi:HK97 gp10 family phage protein